MNSSFARSGIDSPAEFVAAIVAAEEPNLGVSIERICAPVHAGFWWSSAMAGRELVEVRGGLVPRW